MSEATGPDLSRRAFVQTLSASALAATVPPTGWNRARETPIARFYHALTGDLKARICFPSDHPLRLQVRANWSVVKPRVGDLSRERQAACADIFKTLCGDDGHERFLRQMAEDDGGFENYHVAVFGEPGAAAPFEWVLTGRHATLRADGHRDAGASFHGPIFYGHARPTRHVWWFQVERARRLFATLDGLQKSRAIVSPFASADPQRNAGLSIGDLDGGQKSMVRALLMDLFAPFRMDVGERARQSLCEAHGLDALRLAFCRNDETRRVGVQDIWKIDGPAFSWFFHGAPHVHAWLNLAPRSPGA